jgi:uncharacterized protein YbjT (DUF2867 family)
MRTVGLFGATGNIGQHLLPLLVSEPTIEEIRIITKRPGQIESEVQNHAKAKGKRIVIIKGDYCSDELAVTTTIRGCSRLFVVLPQSLSSQEIIEKGKLVADCALMSGVEAIVRISSLGIDEQSVNFVGSQGPLGDSHIAIETYCAEVGLKQVSLRPTSLFSNINFNVDEIVSNSTLSTPLGTVAKVNWVSCEDVAKVAAKVLVATKWDQFGKIIDITGPRENTLGAKEMAQMISASVSKTIEYKEVDVPPVPDYAGLWNFLRRGGYDCHCDTIERITGNPGQRFSDIKII